MSENCAGRAQLARQFPVMMGKYWEFENGSNGPDGGNGQNSRIF